MSTYLSQSPFDCSVYGNFLQWAQTVGAGLLAVGLKKVSDPGTVIWANLASGAFAPQIPNNITPVRPGTYRFQGAWLTGTTYSGTVSANGTNDIVTDGGVTYECVSSNGTPFVLTSVANAAGGVTVYTGTITGGTTPNYVGHTFVIAGFTNGVNNGTFVCTACSTTTLTLVNASGAAETHAATASCKPTLYTTLPANPIWVPYLYEIFRTDDQKNATKALSQVAVSGQVVTYTLNGASANYTVGEAITIAGFANAGNNGTFCVTSVTGTASFTVHLVGQTNETLAATVYNCNFPLYIKIGYGSCANVNPSPVITFALGTTLGTGITGGLSGSVQGTMFNSLGTPSEFNSQGASALANSSVYTDMHFQSSDGGPFSMILFRQPAGASTNVSNIYLACDRARDTAGNTLTAYWMIVSHSVANTARAQLLMQPGTGAAIPSGGWTQSWPTINQGSLSWLSAGLTPVKPIFPMPGYIGNPMLQAVVLWGADVAEGGLVNAVLYGASHTFVVSKGGGNVVDGLGAGAMGIRWE